MSSDAFHQTCKHISTCRTLVLLALPRLTYVVVKKILYMYAKQVTIDMNREALTSPMQ